MTKSKSTEPAAGRRGVQGAQPRVGVVRRIPAAKRRLRSSSIQGLFMSAVEFSFPNIDYGTHPYYREIAAGLTSDDRAASLARFYEVFRKLVRIE